ncbi:MAG: hypothetical protein ACXACD_22450 [Candidatus Thorarchaeota archaeon]|jgi:hypothetical protein
MKKTTKKLVFTIEASVEVSASDVFRLRDVEDIVEQLQSIGAEYRRG